MQVIFPNNNEEEFQRVAKEINAGPLLMVYPFSKMPAKAYLVPPSKLATIKKGPLAFVKSPSSVRSVVEQKRTDVLFDIEDEPKKDKFTERRSGLNHIIANLMAKNEIAYGISLSSIIQSKYQTQKLGRIQQNVMLCNKFKVRVLVSSFALRPMELRAREDLLAFARVLKVRYLFSQKDSLP